MTCAPAPADPDLSSVITAPILPEREASRGAISASLLSSPMSARGPRLCGCPASATRCPDGRGKRRGDPPLNTHLRTLVHTCTHVSTPVHTHSVCVHVCASIYMSSRAVKCARSCTRVYICAQACACVCRRVHKSYMCVYCVRVCTLCTTVYLWHKHDITCAHVCLGVHLCLCMCAYVHVCACMCLNLRELAGNQS